MIRRVAKLRYIRVAGLAAGAVAVAGTAVVITASAAGITFGARPSSSTPATADVESATAAAVCSTFMQHFATDIGKSQAQINTAFQKAIGETLADDTGKVVIPEGETQLQTDLKGGQSLSQVATAQHVTEADFRTRLIANLKPVMDKAVTDKKMTAAQEQALVSRLQTGPLPLWNAAPKRPKTGASPNPSPTTT